MKIPAKPPSLDRLLKGVSGNLPTILDVAFKNNNPIAPYYHWDKFRFLKPPAGITIEEFWLAVKLQRFSNSKPVPLKDKAGNHFRFSVPDKPLAELHRIDVGTGGVIGLPDQITNPQTRDRYIVRSLVEEAITSSQLEGAATTREVAKEMIRTGRPPRDTSEQMIYNNYATMQRITEMKDEPLTLPLLLEIHRLVTDKTLDDNSAAGRFRRSDEKRVVGDNYGEVFHDPPPAEELEARIAAMCDFANDKSSSPFIHPVIRAIIVHFWLAYDHPFVDGNGRTARALFYWAMLNHGYWLFEFISISHVLRKSPAKYARSFLYTETDDNDLTYFIVHQAKVICGAIEDLHTYIGQKAQEVGELEKHLRALDIFNHRQVEVIRHALKHPDQLYSIETHKRTNKVVYQTARNDLLTLAKNNLLNETRRGRKLIFSVPRNLSDRLLKIGKAASS